MMTLANAITLFRLALVPVFIYLFVKGEQGWAFAAFCVAGGSDIVDGTVARLLKQRSSWGALLDPIADKILLESAFICLVVAGVLPLWFFLLALMRDIMIIAGIAFFKIRHIDFAYRAIWPSKFATLVQMVTIVIGLVVLWRPGMTAWGVSFETALSCSMFCATALIVVSGMLYIRLGLRLLRDHKQRLATQES